MDFVSRLESKQHMIKLHIAAASLLVKSRIGRWHASNLGLYFSHFRSDDKATVLCSSLFCISMEMVYLRSSFLQSSFIYCTVALHVSKQQNFFGTLARVISHCLSVEMQSRQSTTHSHSTQISICNFAFLCFHLGLYAHMKTIKFSLHVLSVDFCEQISMRICSTVAQQESSAMFPCAFSLVENLHFLPFVEEGI